MHAVSFPPTFQSPVNNSVEFVDLGKNHSPFDSAVKPNTDGSDKLTESTYYRSRAEARLCGVLWDQYKERDKCVLEEERQQTGV